jgi:fatty acid desaturase
MGNDMNTETQQLLHRWQSLRSGVGLARAASLARVLWFLSLVLCLVVVAGLWFGFPPVIPVVASVIMGWVVAERNALKSRMAQWHVVAGYIDWVRVDNDLDGSQQVMPSD